MEYARADCRSGDVSRAAAQATVLCVAYSPEGDVVAVGCTDGCVRVWCARTLRLLRGPLRRRGDEDRAPVQTVAWMLLPPACATDSVAEAKVLTAGAAADGAGTGAGAGAGASAGRGERAAGAGAACRVLVAGYHDGSICAWHGTPTPATPDVTPRAIMLGRHWGPVRRLVVPAAPGLALVTGAWRRAHCGGCTMVLCALTWP